MSIHPTAIVDPKSKIHPSCKIGPYCVIGAEVELGEGCHLVSHVAIEGPDENWRGQRLFPFHFDWHGSAGYYLCGRADSAGDWRPQRDSRVCHHQPRHGEGRGCTRVGDHNLIMAYTHIAHDCQIGSHIIMANAATLGGHVTVEDWANGGGAVPGASFCADRDARFYWRGHAPSRAMCCHFRRLRPSAARRLMD